MPTSGGMIALLLASVWYWAVIINSHSAAKAQTGI